MRPALIAIAPALDQDEPQRGQVTEADLLRTIAEAADADTDFCGLGDFSQVYRSAADTMPFEHAGQLQPAEACTELGAHTAPLPAFIFPLEPLFARCPVRTSLAVLAFLTSLLLLGGHIDGIPRDFAAGVANDLAAEDLTAAAFFAAPSAPASGVQ